jgi:hypothetical protein
LELHRSPAELLPHDYFLPDTTEGPVTLGFPYGLTLLRVALLPRVRDILWGRAEWSRFYSADHPSGALRLLAAICEAFVHKADSRGEHVLVVMLPVAKSFRQHAIRGEFEYAPLVAALAAKGVQTYDPGPAMLEALAGRSYCELFTQRNSCDGHYSILGNTMMAELVAAELRRRKFVKG